MTDEKPKLRLIGEDGNAFFILGKARKVALEAGWTKEKIDEFMTKATAGNYDHLLSVCREYFDIF